MPGIVVFRRRWSVGSDDFVVPAIILAFFHAVWLVVILVLIFLVKEEALCWPSLIPHVIIYLVLLSGCLIVEILMAFVSMRGTILDAGPRNSIKYLIYARFLLFILEVIWLISGVIWMSKNEDCNSRTVKKVILGIVICNCCVLMCVVIATWCSFDSAGRSWVKMKKYQRSLKDSQSRFQYKRSGSRQRNWRQRKVLRAYQSSWDHRCRFLFCCINKKDGNNSSFGDIARLLSEFFRDLDVVPSDVVAGLVLLRRYQKEERQRTVASHKNDVYQFLSGVPVIPTTKFLQLSTSEGQAEFKEIVHYMKFAVAVYGWAMYLMMSSTDKICDSSLMFGCCHNSSEKSEVVGDNCCGCNAAALLKMAPPDNVELVYVTFHVDVAAPPFLVALDHNKKAVIISIRGTLCMKDLITDLNAESEPLPLDRIKDDWLGHKGMVAAAEYIRKKLKEEKILERAFHSNEDGGTHAYNLVLVGHSLGAGTACILSILLKQQYESLKCYAYSPPGGLLSMPAVEHTKSFTTAVVVGKDVIPRIGLHQLEALRADLISAIQRSADPKWRTISASIHCCGGVGHELANDGEVDAWSSSRAKMRDQAWHPNDSSIALTVHQPLFPPGNILHIVRNHPKKEQQKYDKDKKKWFRTTKPVYQGIWVDNQSFDEVLISPCMVQDHMPDSLLEAMAAVLETLGPPKPQRQDSKSTQNSCEVDETQDSKHLLQYSSSIPTFSDQFQEPLLSSQEGSEVQSPVMVKHDNSWTHMKKATPTPPHKLMLETSFTCTPLSSPDTRLNMRNHVNISGLTWEILSALEDELLFNLASSHRLAISDEWLDTAPLASPEILSEVSSIASRASLYRRQIKKNNSNLAPIHGSFSSDTLDCKNNSRYCYYINDNTKASGPYVGSESSSDEEESRNISNPSFPIEPIMSVRTSTDGCKQSILCNQRNNDEVSLRRTSRHMNSVKFKQHETEIEDNKSLSSNGSSKSLSKEKFERNSVQSRDSGFGDRLNESDSMYQLSSESSNLLNQGVETPQQEYGRDLTSLAPFYLYMSSPTSNTSSNENQAPIEVDFNMPKIPLPKSKMENTTPLLDNLSAAAKSTSIRKLNSESSL